MYLKQYEGRYYLVITKYNLRVSYELTKQEYEKLKTVLKEYTK